MDEVPVYFVKFSNQNNIDTEWDEEEMEKKGGGGMNGDDNESEDSMAFFSIWMIRQNGNSILWILCR